jgi:preprotein translocase subunit SecE
MSTVDMKLNQARANMEANKAQQKSRKSLFTHIQELKDELKKVSWTTQEELKFSTKIVIWSVLIFGMGIYLVDFVIKGGLEFVKTVVHFIFG